MQREIKFRLWNPERKVVTGGNHINTLLCTTNTDFVVEFEKNNMVWMQYTGLKDEKGREIYEDDIYFDEIEEDDGDIRLYYVCKWIKEWARFVWLSIDGELQDYKDNGVEHFLENEFIMETPRMHYAGNIHQNPELLTK